MIDHDALLAEIDRHKDNAYGSDEGTSLGSARAKAIEYYLGLNTNPAPEGRSQTVSRDTFQVIQTVLPSLVRIFANSADDICKLVPVGPDDEQAAELATAALTHIVQSQNNWEQICSDWVHDALLLANSYAIAYWDERDTSVREVYEGQSDDQVAALLADKNVTVIQHSETVDEQATAEAQQAYSQAMQQYQMQAQMAQMQAAGQPPQLPPPPQPPQPVMRHDLVIERKETDGHACIKTLPPEHCYISSDTPDWTLKEAPYFEFRSQKTIAELRSMGLDVPEDISDDESADSDEDAARNRFGEDDSFSEDGPGVMRRVWARMIWVRADAEGDGQSRLYYVVAVGRTILHSESCARIPVASMTPQPLPHRHIGMSLAELTYETQDIKTALKRGALDNLRLVNTPRTGISSRVNLDDFLTATPGGVIRMLDDSLPAEGHFMPIQHPFVFEQVVGSIEYFDQESQNVTGATRYFSGTDAGAINKTAHGTQMLQNAAATRVEHIARMMAPAVEYLFSVAWEIWSKHANKALTIKLKGKWQTIDPQAWRTKRDVKIAVGVGAGNKDSMMSQLGAIFGAQMQTLPLGIARPENIFATALEMAKLAGFSNPEKFWTDPTNAPPMPQQPPPEILKTQMQLQADAQKFQAQTQQDQLKFQAESQLERERMAMQAELDRNRQEWEARQKSLEAQQKAEIDRIKAEHDAAMAMREIEIEQQRLAFEKYKADLDAQTKLAIADKSAPPPIDLTPIQSAIEEMVGSRPVKAERIKDEAGRLIGVRKLLANGKTEEVMIQ